MRTSFIAKIATRIGMAAVVLGFAAGAGLAAGRPGNGHPSGGHPGGGHPGGGHPAFVAHGGGHPAFVPHGGGGVHFAPHPTFSRGGVHFAPHARIGRISHPRFHGVRAHGRVTRFGRTITRPGRGHATVRSVTHNRTRAVVTHAPAAHVTAARIHRPITPHSFAATRHFTGARAFRPFLGRRWFFHRHYGWVGPWFWPYAYGDFFYYALWPYAYAYYDPFWYYGYDDIYEGIFSPYDYQDYVRGPGAPARLSELTQTVAQSCTDEAAEVTGWPIDQIQAAVQPNPQQTSLLDDLGNAIIKASDVVKSHCPTRVSFTPTDRLADMQTRLEGLVQAVNLVQPPLAKFYDSLTDEQKARFNAIGAPGGKAPSQGQQAAANPQAACSESVMAFPSDQIDRIVQPSDAQRSKLQALAAANAKAADLIKASCPSEIPATPPDRLAAEGAHLQAMLQAVQIIRPALEDFYNSLSDEQKAHFNTLGRQLFAQK